MSNNTSKVGQQANPIKAQFAMKEVPWFDIKSPLDIETFNYGSSSYTVQPDPDKSRQKKLAEAAYNRNSMEEKMRKFRNSSYSGRGLWNSVIVNNVSVFNRYIYNRVADIAKKELDDEVSTIGDITHKESLQSFVDLYNNVYASNVYASKESGVYYTKHTATSLPPLVYGNYIPMNDGTQLFSHDYYDYYSDLVDLMHRYDGFGRTVNDDVKNWLSISCGLHLIGTPEDIEELLMFPGIIVREVSDETIRFISDMAAGSILHAEDQLVKYKLASYYSEEPEWWKNRYSLKTAAGIYTTIGPESPYSESSVFKDPRSFEPISPYFVHQLNPDDRIYKVYIQMSADLVMTAYERSNFFITIRNTNSKMSIKNFLKYLS